MYSGMPSWPSTSDERRASMWTCTDTGVCQHWSSMCEHGRISKSIQQIQTRVYANLHVDTNILCGPTYTKFFKHHNQATKLQHITKHNQNKKNESGRLRHIQIYRWIGSETRSMGWGCIRLHLLDLDTTVHAHMISHKVRNMSLLLRSGLELKPIYTINTGAWQLRYNRHGCMQHHIYMQQICVF